MERKSATRGETRYEQISEGNQRWQKKDGISGDNRFGSIKMASNKIIQKEKKYGDQPNCLSFGHCTDIFQPNTLGDTL